MMQASKARNATLALSAASIGLAAMMCASDCCGA